MQRSGGLFFFFPRIGGCKEKRAFYFWDKSFGRRRTLLGRGNLKKCESAKAGMSITAKLFNAATVKVERSNFL